MKHIRSIPLLVVYIFTMYHANAQNINGRVVDSDNNPLIGATVWWAETSVGATTTSDGEFTIHTVKGYETLVAGFLGYQNDTLKVDAIDNITFSLNQSGVDLDIAVVNSSLGGNYILNEPIAKSEMISFAGLCKMACCNLAESFENSASVTVGYSDALSGARQIQMLGLAGTYTQILDENRPILRGISAPYGLSYTPGMWLNSIQISKGISSVVSGREAITGQINLEMRKPTDDERFFLNLYLNDELRPEVNISTATPVGKSGKLSTVVMLHASMDSDNPMNHTDHNGDGFRDTPLAQQFNVANRWLYTTDNGTQIRWGVKALQDERLGGSIDYSEDMRSDMLTEQIYGSKIVNRNANGYLKVGVPLSRSIYDTQDGSELRDNFALMLDVDLFSEDAYFGLNDYQGEQLSSQLNIMYNSYLSTKSSYIIGASSNIFSYKESVANFTPWLNSSIDYNGDRVEAEAGIFGEYTYKQSDKFSAIAGVRYDYNNYFEQGYLTPRGHIRWEPIEGTIVRASGGMGYRTTNVITDNIGVLATGRAIIFEQGYDSDFNRTEEALTWGASISQRFSIINSGDATLSVEYFRTQFFNQVIVDQERNSEYIYIYSSGDRSSTDTYQVDFTWGACEGLDIFASYRYTNSSITLIDDEGQKYSVERALVSKFKTLLNIQYATPYRRWVFDATAQLNGSMRLPSQSGDALSSSYSPIYPMLYAQVSHRIRDWELYLGCENITNYTQDEPIISADNPFSSAFNSSSIWGPLMGRKFYIGCRFNIY